MSKTVQQAEKTAAALQGLQSRLEPQRQALEEDLGQELQEYFSASAPPPSATGELTDEIRERVIDGVAERILRSWEDSRGQLSSSLKGAVIERLIERVTDRLAKGAFPDNGVRTKA